MWRESEKIFMNIPSTALSSWGFAFWECLQKRWRWNCESSRNLRQPRENWTSSTKAQSLYGLSHTAALISWEKKANKSKVRSSCQLVWTCMDPGMKIVHMAIDHTWYRQPSCIFTCQNFLFLFPKYTKALPGFLVLTSVLPFSRSLCVVTVILTHPFPKGRKDSTVETRWNKPADTRCFFLLCV